MNRLAVAVLLVIGVGGVCRFANAQKETTPLRKQTPKTAISADDINRRFVVIGPLGIPIGEVATVDGTTVINQGKGAPLLFQVTSVNGRALSKPVTMPYRIWPWSGLNKLDAQSRCRLRVFQDGGFAGVPLQAMKETTYVQTHAYHFVTSLVVVRNASVPAHKGKGQ